jgi:uncharacterized membrane protein YhaH (DUF805 family)
MKLPSTREIIKLYTSFEGRISQEQFWLGFLGIALPLAAIHGIATTVLYYLSPLGSPEGMQRFGEAFTAETPDMSVFTDMLGWMSAILWATIVALVVGFVPTAAILIKRRHDRGSRGILAWAFMVLSPLPYLYFALVTTMPADPLLLALGGPMAFLMLALFGVAIHLFIVCGILEGTAGPNRYGPEPKAKPAVSPRA